MLLAGCEDELGKDEDGRMTFDENTIAFTLGQSSNTRAVGTASTVVAPSNVFDLPGETADEPDFCLMETVTDMNEEVFDAVGETRATPVYTENFYDLYGTDLYGTAFEPQTGTAQLTDVWGSYLENGGTVNFKKVADTDNTYAYDYSRGQKVNLAWPEGNKLLYFLQAPYTTTKDLNPKFYADGHIEFEYTDPTTPVSGVIANGATAQKDFLFTSKVMEKDTKDTKNHVLLYHALTGVKFKVGEMEEIGGNITQVKTTITKVTLKGIKANGHCTIRPNYVDGTNTSDGNPSNKKNETNANTKSAVCSTWSQHSTDEDLVVDYSQTYSGVVDYAKGDDSNFADSFYDTDKNTHLKNMGRKDGSEILFMVPQDLTNAEIVVDFTVTYGEVSHSYQRKAKLTTSWKAGEIHTYTLTINQVAVSVDDSMNAQLTEKNGVTTSNVGNTCAYLRATYAIAWYYGYGEDAVCVAAYQGNGEFIYMAGPNEKDHHNPTWIKGSDGFYYYKWAVKPGASTRFPFFGSFTAPSVSETGPFPGSHLEMKILLQGVQYDQGKKKVGQAWGDVYTVDADGNPTTTKIVDVLSNEIENLYM